MTDNCVSSKSIAHWPSVNC